MSFFNSGLQNQYADGIKVFREESEGVPPEAKPNQGANLSQNLTTGEKTITGVGEEEGWLRLEKNTSSTDRTCDAWTMVAPVMLNMTEETVIPVKDKTGTTDEENFSLKVRDTNAGTSTKFNYFGSRPNKMAGIVVTCPNHASQEQLFIPTETVCLVKITSPSNPSGGVIPFSSYPWGVIIEGQKLYGNQTMYFTLRYASGKTGIPNGSEIETNQVISIYSAPELSKKGVYEWVAFVQFPLAGEALVIKDNGDGTGIPVSLSLGNEWTEYGVTKPLLQVGSSYFHGEVWLSGNLYIGRDVGTYYAVSRAGYGAQIKTFTANGVSIGVDTAGHIVDAWS